MKGQVRMTFWFTPGERSNGATVTQQIWVTDGSQTIGPFTADEADALGYALRAAAQAQHVVSGYAS